MVRLIGKWVQNKHRKVDAKVPVLKLSGPLFHLCHSFCRGMSFFGRFSNPFDDYSNTSYSL